jgi:hypothetical protein
MSISPNTQEAIMGQAIPTRHPSVVLRSHYNHVRALLVAALIAVIGLSTAVVILANDDDPTVGVGTATPAVAPTPGERYDGGPEEGTADIATSRAPVARYDGGPEEGAAARTVSPAPSGSASSTESTTPPPSSIAASEGSKYGKLRETAPQQRYDGGPEEGSVGLGR